MPTLPLLNMHYIFNKVCKVMLKTKAGSTLETKCTRVDAKAIKLMVIIRTFKRYDFTIARRCIRKLQGGMGVGHSNSNVSFRINSNGIF